MKFTFDVFVFTLFYFWQMFSKKKFVILCDKYGNIGNQLYMSCFLIKWAEQFDVLIFNFGLIHNNKYFIKPSSDIFLRYPYTKSLKSQRVQVILASSLNRISLRLLKLKFLRNINSFNLLQITSNDEFRDLESSIPKNNITFVRGFIHDQPYSIFRNVFSKIKEYLKPFQHFQMKVMEPLISLSDSDVIVGITIRHGDYKTWQDGKYYLTTETYQKWMEKVESLFKSKKVGFFIASDDDQDLSIFKKHEFFFRSGHPIENLYSLSNCDFLLSVPSSFTGWAHFIGETPIFNLDARVRKLSSNFFQNW